MSDLSALVKETPVAAGLKHRIVEVTDHAELARHVQPWEQLIEQIAEPNVFYAPWALLPAVRHLRGGQAVRVLLFYQDAERGQLDGVIPLFERTCGGFPALLHAYQHRYCFLCEPLLRPGREAEVAETFVTWLHQRRFRWPLLRLCGLDGNGLWLPRLEAALEAGRVHFRRTRTLQRALLRTGGDLQAYLAHIPAKKRREYRRLRERLAEQGELRVDVLQPGAADLQVWLDQFVTLEARGWKGREGTALGSRPACRQFFEETAHSFHQRGRLMMLRMTLDGRPLAMSCDFLGPPGRYAFKTAYDEDYSRYAPGVLLELENACLAFESGLQWLDSCAAPDNEMINRIYPDRRTLVDLTVCPLGAARGVLWLAARLKQLRQRWRASGSP